MGTKRTKTAGSSQAARLSASRARQRFAETLDLVRHGRERVILHRHGREVAAIVPVEDLRLLEELEDRADVAAARRRVRDKSDGTVSYESLREELGLARGSAESSPRRFRKGA